MTQIIVKMFSDTSTIKEIYVHGMKQDINGMKVGKDTQEFLKMFREINHYIKLIDNADIGTYTIIIDIDKYPSSIKLFADSIELKLPFRNDFQIGGTLGNFVQSYKVISDHMPSLLTQPYSVAVDSEKIRKSSNGGVVLISGSKKAKKSLLSNIQGDITRILREENEVDFDAMCNVVKKYTKSRSISYYREVIGRVANGIEILDGMTVERRVISKSGRGRPSVVKITYRQVDLKDLYPSNKKMR